MARASSGRPCRLYRCAATRSRSSALPPSARILHTAVARRWHFGKTRTVSDQPDASPLWRKIDPSRAPLPGTVYATGCVGPRP